MNQRIVEEMEELVHISQSLALDASRSSSSLGDERVQELIAVAARGGDMIVRLYGDNSQHFKMLAAAVETPNFEMMHKNWYTHVSKLAGVMSSVLHDLKAGMLDDFQSLIRAEVFGDFLEMAEHLLIEGYKDASAVLLGAVLEDALRKIASKYEVETHRSNGRPLTIDPLNNSLCQQGTYNALVKKQITSWANLRNDAAHGRFAEYDSAQVKQMLLFVQKFCADYLK